MPHLGPFGDWDAYDPDEIGHKEKIRLREERDQLRAQLDAALTDNAALMKRAIVVQQPGERCVFCNAVLNIDECPPIIHINDCVLRQLHPGEALLVEMDKLREHVSALETRLRAAELWAAETLLGWEECPCGTQCGLLRDRDGAVIGSEKGDLRGWNGFGRIVEAMKRGGRDCIVHLQVTDWAVNVRFDGQAGVWGHTDPGIAVARAAYAALTATADSPQPGSP